MMNELALYKEAFLMDVVGKAIADRAGNWIKVNPSFCRIVGYDEQPLRNRRLYDLFPWLRSKLEELQRGLSASAAFEQPYVASSGASHSLLIHLHLFASGSRDTHYFMIQAIDITERAGGGHRMPYPDWRLGGVLDALSEGICGIDPDGNIMFWNSAAERMTGYSRKDLGKRRFRDLLLPSGPPEHAESAAPHEPPDGAHAPASPAAVRSDMFRRKDGSAIPVEYSINAIYENDRQIGSLVAFNDVTDRMDSRARIIQSEKLSLAGQLAAGIAHEIRNPLTSLKGFLQLMRASAADPAKREAYLAIMRDELDRIEQILSELLVLSKPQSVQFVRKRIAALIDQVVSLLQPQALLKNTEIRVQPLNEILHVYCDENQIKQVLINIIKNGIEAMPGGGRIDIVVRAEGQYAAIGISDQGGGIPESMLKKLGEPFQTTKENGTGLGLMVSYKIIENHNGSIEVRSEPGQGSTFTVRLPRTGGSRSG